MNLNHHGGACCGRRHIYGFNTVTPRELRDLDNAMRSKGLCYEITLTGSQLTRWWPELKKRGFKQVYKFRNSNSGNTVTVLLYASSARAVADLKEVVSVSGRFFRIPKGQPGAGRFARRERSAS